MQERPEAEMNLSGRGLPRLGIHGAPQRQRAGQAPPLRTMKEWRTEVRRHTFEEVPRCVRLLGTALGIIHFSCGLLRHGSLDGARDKFSRALRRRSGASHRTPNRHTQHKRTANAALLGNPFSKPKANAASRAVCEVAPSGAGFSTSRPCRRHGLRLPRPFFPLP